MDISAQISSAVKHPMAVPIALGISFVGGLGFGYILGKRQAKTVYLNQTDDYEQLALDFNKTSNTAAVYSQIQDIIMTNEYDTVSEEVPEQLAEAIEDNRIQYVENEEVKVLNIFDKPDDNWDYDVELGNRSSEMPYIIHVDEFVADEMGFKQDTLTYYEGDDVMCDSMDTPVYNYSSMMGELKFGHGSNDKNVVYIRNEKLNMEWEVLRHTGMYTTEVLGNHYEKELEEDIRHANLNRKFRMD